jgi:Tfp pilus assembly protein PilO
MSRSFSGDPKLLVRIVLGVLAGANLIAAGLLLFPPGGSEEDLERQLASLQPRIQTRQAVLQQTRQHVASVQTGRAQGDGFLNDYFLPSRTHVSELFTELEAAVTQSKIKEREHSIEIEPIEGSDALSMLAITAAYEGTYAQLMSFVHEIDLSPGLLIIDSLNVQPQQSGGVLSVSMKLETFVREDAGQ